jgi:release factor glutamine methyltransferase
MRPLAQVIALAAAPTSEVAVEHDDTTGQQVRALLEEAGVGQTRQHRDFAGRDRFVSGRVRRDPGYRPTKIKNL